MALGTWKIIIQSPLFTLLHSGSYGSNFRGNDVPPLSSPTGSRSDSFSSLFALPRASAHKIRNHKTADGCVLSNDTIFYYSFWKKLQFKNFIIRYIN